MYCCMSNFLRPLSAIVPDFQILIDVLIVLGIALIIYFSPWTRELRIGISEKISDASATIETPRSDKSPGSEAIRHQLQAPAYFSPQGARF